MGAASTAISSQGLDLDLSEQSVLMSMCSGARCRVVALAHGWLEPVMGWMRAQGKQARLRWLLCGGGDTDGRRKKTCVVNLDPSRYIYRGGPPDPPVESPSTVLCPPQRIYFGNLATRSHRIFRKQLSSDLNSGFRSSDTTTSLGRPDDNISIHTKSISPHITLI
jgi:hypothetical protein